MRSYRRYDWVMGHHFDKVEKSYADNGGMLAWGNLIACVACLFDYFVSGRPWALETLALLCLTFNGGFLALRHHELRQARTLDARDEATGARWAAERERRGEE